MKITLWAIRLEFNFVHTNPDFFKLSLPPNYPSLHNNIFNMYTQLHMYVMNRFITINPIGPINRGLTRLKRVYRFCT